MTAPCYQCPDRRDGCHSDRESYKAFRADKDREYEERARRGDMAHIHFDMMTKAIRRVTRKK